jgi:predicted RNA binding protein YcfA (HicA-like mRNA interferase family)
MNIEKKKDIINKVSNLSNVQQNEIFNIIKKNNINYTCNKNGIFINITKINDDLVNEILDYVAFLESNNISLDIIETEYTKYYNNRNNVNDIYKIINFKEFNNLNTKNIEKMIENINFNKNKKKESHLKFTNTMKKYNRVLLNSESENYINNLNYEKYRI